MAEIVTRKISTRKIIPLATILFLPLLAFSQTNCEEGNGLLDFSPLKTTTVPEVIRKLADAESRAKEARSHYSYTQDVLVQSLNGKNADGQFHEVSSISYDPKGRRQENVTYAEEPTLRRIQLTQEDMDDIRVFMPFMLTAEDLPLYNLTYAGQQHVDDLDTYVFHVEPKKEERNRRYFQGRIWIDSQDFQIVKLCGKSVPEPVRVKRNQRQDLRPTFVTYRQQVDGQFWFPAYTRSDDTLRFRNASIHIREVIKYSNYKRSAANVAGASALKP
jgi:hypothetical protein